MARPTKPWAVRTNSLPIGNLRRGPTTPNRGRFNEGIAPFFRRGNIHDEA
jgi:hypothetical protein